MSLCLKVNCQKLQATDTCERLGKSGYLVLTQQPGETIGFQATFSKYFSITLLLCSK